MGTYKIFENGIEINRIIADESFCQVHYNKNGYTYEEEKRMTIIKIEPHDNGAHDNQTSSAPIPVPAGYAVIPEDVGTPETLENYPFGEITVKNVDGVPTVTSWTPIPFPEPEPEQEPDPTQLDRVEAQVTYTAMMTDTLLEV